MSAVLLNVFAKVSEDSIVWIIGDNDEGWGIW
jgi:hypothetical protein